jgi:hypothetical protein
LTGFSLGAVTAQHSFGSLPTKTDQSDFAATRFDVSCAEAAEQISAKTQATEEITVFNIRNALIEFAGRPMGAEVLSGRRGRPLVWGT